MEPSIDPFVDETEYPPLKLDSMDEIVDIQDCLPIGGEATDELREEYLD